MWHCLEGLDSFVGDHSGSWKIGYNVTGGHLRVVKMIGPKGWQSLGRGTEKFESRAMAALTGQTSNQQVRRRLLYF